MLVSGTLSLFVRIFTENFFGKMVSVATTFSKTSPKFKETKQNFVIRGMHFVLFVFMVAYQREMFH